ncbi:uncharacterized protein LOC114265350 [Camellia sinensis]|uniref:uncharacterized protein LOC114265350 n=1 Tax=Camellia sinensis TaxID=4442 RepID=UPI001035EC6A|nr:uncharacterized protein LOC114265350 [Camellia sinensis]
MEEETLKRFSSSIKEELATLLSHDTWPPDPAARPKLSGQFKNIGGHQTMELLEADFTEEEVRNVIKNSDALIPKVDSPSSLRDYRPISLIGSLYKILAKVLANRMKQVMPRIISESQSAFLGDRNILDRILIANEIVDGWRKSNKKGLVLKLDFEKAYDSVNWEFLFNMLSNFGFGDRWVRWMKTCVTSTKVSVLVNGSPTGEFCPQRGLRQGNPLPPFLFNIVAEGLNILLVRAKEMSLIKGATIRNNGLTVTHLQFADDTILFCEAEWVEVVTIKRILRCFEIFSGLKINYHKSVIAGIGVDEVLLQSFAFRLNCAHQRLPFKYLGLLLGANPVGVAKAIDNIQANFLWRGSDLRRKVHMYLANSAIELGNGRRTLFWLDKWAWELSFKEEFPRLFSLFTNKIGVVSDFYNRSGGFQVWNLEFRRTLLAWKEEEVSRIHSFFMNAPAMRVTKQDAWKWKADPSGLFSVASMYKSYELSLGPVRKMAEVVWNNCGPPKVKFLGWLAWQGKVKTSSFLQHIGILAASTNVGCVFCQAEVESVNHILLFCPFV